MSSKRIVLVYPHSAADPTVLPSAPINMFAAFRRRQILRSDVELRCITGREHLQGYTSPGPDIVVLPPDAAVPDWLREDAEAIGSLLIDEVTFKQKYTA